MPLANAFLRPEQLAKPEPRYPLHARVCDRCLLVQVDAVVRREEIFEDYAYFSSYSSSWVEHARRFAEAATRRFALDGNSLVVEVASNDGYLLKHFVAQGIPCRGIEPARNVAAVAEAAGVPTEVCFLGRDTGAALRARGLAADLLVANNVLAHVPDLHDFVAGLAALLKPAGTLSIEFPHLLRLIEEVQFDTIYHEHFCYFSLAPVERLLAEHGLAGLRCRATPHPRRLAARAGRAGREQARRRPGPRRRARRRARRRPRQARVLRRLRAQGARRLRRADRVPGDRPPRRQEGRRLRRRRQGQHAPQRLRHRPGPHRLRRRRQPPQAGPLHPRQPSGDPPARGRGGSAARLPAHPALEPARRDHGQARLHPRAGAAASSCRSRTCRCCREVRPHPHPRRR